MSIHVCITLTYDNQTLICYQKWRLIISSTIVYFEGTYFNFYPFGITIDWMTTYPDYFTHPAILPEIAYEVMSTAWFAISVSFNKRITWNMLKQKGHFL